jgi:hypothetical protein
MDRPSADRVRTLKKERSGKAATANLVRDIALVLAVYPDRPQALSFEPSALCPESSVSAGLAPSVAANLHPIMHSFAPLPQRKSCKIEPAASGENVPACPAERPVGAGFRKLTNVKLITPVPRDDWNIVGSSSNVADFDSPARAAHIQTRQLLGDGR